MCLLNIDCTEQSTDKEEKKDEATNTNEVLPEDGTDKGTAFTTPGNGEVKDDITDDSTKEFLTVTTKNNNTFYIVKMCIRDRFRWE